MHPFTLTVIADSKRGGWWSGVHAIHGTPVSHKSTAALQKPNCCFSELFGYYSCM